MTTTEIPAVSATAEHIAQAGPADLVVGIVGRSDPPALAAVVRATRVGLGSLLPGRRALVLHPPDVDPGAPESASVTAIGAASLQEADQARTVRTVLEAGSRNGAVCALVDATCRSEDPSWTGPLLRPILDQGFDLVVPVYQRRRFGGAVNTAILYPLMRVLYGHRVRQPAPAEFALSPTLATHLLGRDMWTGEYGRLGTAVQLVPETIAGKFRICQTFLSRRPAAPADPALELTTVMVQTVGALFRRMERDAAVWQKTKGSEPVPTFGEPDSAETPEPALDVTAMVESFRLGHRSLQEVWGLVFTPATLVELKKVSQLPAERFRLPDTLWVSIIYDAALSYRLRVIGRDHLLRALTPLYWGWLASFVLEMQQADSAGLEKRIEALCLAFESSRPYLISRWRWPDRFTP